MPTEADSILNSVKKVLGIDPAYSAFDLDITMHINTVFFTLQQLGIGSPDGFLIEDDTTVWADYLGSDKNYNAVRTYIYLRVRVLFDPPTVPSTMTAIENQIKELEWRLNIEAENLKVINQPKVPIGMEHDEMGDPKKYRLGEILVDPVTGDVWRDY